MAITIDLLKNHPQAISPLAKIWYEVLGSVWIPNASIQKAEAEYAQHLNDRLLPLTLIAMEKNKPLGMCSLRDNDGIRPDLSPWLGSLVIDQNHQRQGIGKKLLDAALLKAKTLGIKKLYLFVLDQSLIDYYAALGWVNFGLDTYKGKTVCIMERRIDG